LKSSTAVGGSWGAPFGPSFPDEGRNTRSALRTTSFSVPSWFATSTSTTVGFGCAGTVRVSRAR